MKLESGTRLGPYEIAGAIGAGGMGEVFRARDTRLERSVAIKVIPPHLAANDQLLARFEREARVVSSLSHPNICTLYDVGEVPGEEPSAEALHYFVMELVEGETLDERIRRGPLPLREVIAVGAQIARALEHAHARGVIHRDLKPSNIMLTGSGVKLLDFGLSKMLRESEGELADDASRTVQRGITEEGVVLGTFQYMSPEQAEGKPADQRTDIFALGAVLYEMVSGRRAFEGSSRASLIAAIMAIDPPQMSELRPGVPPALERVIVNCLAKNPGERWQSAHDVRIALEMSGIAAPAAEPVTVSGRRWAIVPWLVAALAIVAALGLWTQREDAPPRPVAFEILSGELRYHWDESPVRLSPDGRRLVFGLRGADGTAEGLFVRDLDRLEIRGLVDGWTYDVSWSWGGQEILFFESSAMRKIAASGGPVTMLTSTRDSRGGSWGPDGTILFTPDVASGIQRIDAAGGEVRAVTVVDEEQGDIGHWRPEFLPDGRHFLFLVHSENASRRGIWLGSLDGNVRPLIATNSAPVFAAPDRVLYFHEGNLYAQRLDMKRLEPVGSPERITEAIAYARRWNNPGFTASRTGALAWHRSEGARDTPIFSYDTSGKRLGDLEMNGGNLDLSRDGRRLAVQSAGGEFPDLWVIDIERGARTRVTSDELAEVGPVWSPDGDWLAYVIPDSPFRLMKVRSNGTGSPEEILRAPEIGGEVIDWSRDGRWLLLEIFTPEDEVDLRTVDLQAAKREMTPLLATRFSESSARFSPDGRWFTYQTNDSGREEIFVQPFPPDGRRFQVSINGGQAARWRGDGRAIYWIGDGKVMSADVDLTSGFEVKNVRAVFDNGSADWVIDSSGERIYISEPAGASSAPIVVRLP